MSCRFNWKQYLDNYPDLVSAGINNQKSAIRHYRFHGKSEGRTYEKIIKFNLKINKEISLNLFDIVIPLGPNDKGLIKGIIEHCKCNVINYRNIYIITAQENLDITDCIIVDEKKFPFKISDINIIKGRNGWYFQQLLKLYASFVIEDILDDYLIIDADTFFLKPTQFIENGVYLFNTGSEYNIPYFDHMKKLHPSLTKQVDCSGISHHMIFNKNILLSLFKMVSEYHKGIEFWKIFLNCVDNKQGSGASEYEIYFNYMLIYHKNLIKIRNLNWKNVSDYIPDNYDYISIHWYSR